MNRFLEIVLSSVWSFLGTLIILLILFIVMMGLLSVILQMRRHRRSLNESDVIKIVREGMDLGKLDAPISRLIKRNEQRGGR
ncbi:hypothetical protein GGQ99_004736 [Aminobacter niigataensis]|uniref:Uncharacterized protein n=1 Tax=Aminobacter niigataensis TaxID=83265 RepID=A0ABR6L819_9HYPH|nr:hypothetical protein [Aminobacter niigataensis]MBB4652952.1 hypothetical protein [Aminobacter niigataensis]